MREREIVTTIQITKIYKGRLFDRINAKGYAKHQMKKIKRMFNADSVVVLDVADTPLQGLRDQMDDEFVLGDEE